MRATLLSSDRGTIAPAGKSDIEVSLREKSAVTVATDGKSAVDCDMWFAAMARSLLGGPGDKPGTQLHYLTGADERLCQRYAAGHVRPPGFFIRTLLRGETGWTWLNALMDGAQPRWWVELHIDLRKARLYDQAQRIFAELH